MPARPVLWDACARVNDTNARKIVLYLAAHEPEERGRDQILGDLGLGMTDREIEDHRRRAKPRRCQSGSPLQGAYPE